MHELPKLPYSYDALEPHIDEQTMKLHHTKHHQAYIDKLNGAVKGTKFENMDVDELIKNLNNVPENIRTAVRNHGGGHSNHSFFWKVMAPNAGGEPTGEVVDEIKKAFNSIEKFKEEFTNAGLNRFGSGWAWLAFDNGKLVVYSTANQVDVWEHAYYKKFGPARADYIKEWWNIVNWQQVEENFKKASK
ncbi:superoxide dismutase [Candidatus Woesearchaeota archaeon]|nr:superoxide dismutase [Candidatus Woesearchaeota archaeon]